MEDTRPKIQFLYTIRRTPKTRRGRASSAKSKRFTANFRTVWAQQIYKGSLTVGDLVAILTRCRSSVDSASTGGTSLSMVPPH